MSFLSPLLTCSYHSFSHAHPLHCPCCSITLSLFFPSSPSSIVTLILILILTLYLYLYLTPTLTLTLSLSHTGRDDSPVLTLTLPSTDTVGTLRLRVAAHFKEPPEVISLLKPGRGGSQLLSGTFLGKNI